MLSVGLREKRLVNVVFSMGYPVRWGRLPRAKACQRPGGRNRTAPDVLRLAWKHADDGRRTFRVVLPYEPSHERNEIRDAERFREDGVRQIFEKSMSG